MWNWVERLEDRRFFAAAPNITASAGRVIFSHVVDQVSRPQWVTVTNRGGASLALSSVSLSGDGAADFFVRKRGVPKTLAPGKSARLRVTFKPTGAELRVASLEIRSNDADTPLVKVALRGLGQAGYFEQNEPSLQRILDTLQIPVNVGDANPSTPKLDGPAGGDEVRMQLLKKAGAGPVRVTPLAVFSWEHTPIARIGWYRPRGGRAQREVITIPEGNGQRLLPAVRGAGAFEPGNNVFGLYSSWLIEPHGDVYSEDAMNTWDTVDAKHKVRFYPYRKASGKLVPHSYVVVMEEAFNSDFQDAVLLVQNIQPHDVPAAPSALLASATSPASIRLTWKDNSANETGFVIERSGKKNGTYAVVGSVGAGLSVFTDMSVTAGGRYYYRVRAVNGARTSAVSNRAVARTPVAMPVRAATSVFSVRTVVSE